MSFSANFLLENLEGCLMVYCTYFLKTRSFQPVAVATSIVVAVTFSLSKFYFILPYRLPVRVHYVYA